MSAFLRKYGTGTGADVIIPMIKRDLVDFAATGDWTPASGDVKISKDGAAEANIGTLPVINGAYGWKFVFADSELQAKSIRVTIVDSATKVVEDQCFIIETYGHASAMYQADLSAANLPANMIQLGSSTQSATDLKDFADTGYDSASHKVAEVSVLTGHTVQTGDSYPIVNSGTHGNAALKSLIDALKAVADAVKLKTDNLPGDPADASDIATAFGIITSAIAALNDLSSAESQSAASAALTAYGAAQAGDEMDLVDAPNATAVSAIKSGLSTHSAADVWSATGRTLSGTLGSFDAIWLKIKAWLRLTLRNDAAIATDHATELAEINQNMGTGAGSYTPADDAQEAPVSVALGPDDIQDIVDGVSQGLSFPTAEDIAAELAGNNVVATFPLLIEGEETVIIQGEDYFDADGNAATVTITATGIETAVADDWDFVFWGQGDSSGQVVTGSPSSGGANAITVKFDLPAAKTSLVTAGLGGWRVVHKPDTTTRKFSEVEGLLRVKPTK